MHKVTCADCGNEAEVPFKPDGERPVYCQDCY
ncbi:MAG: CxxC-x17-CxxC domain-containing protein, partial [Candidatus Heimdallarchaeota archaeon]